MIENSPTWCAVVQIAAGQPGPSGERSTSERGMMMGATVPSRELK
jgi:hypothetical protein